MMNASSYLHSFDKNANSKPVQRFALAIRPAILHLMRSPAFPRCAMLAPAAVLAIVAACRPAAPARRSPLAARSDSAEGGLEHPLARPPVITEATVVAFWLKATDTLKAGQGADLLDDFRNYTALVAPLLKEQDIALVATTADSVIVEMDSGPQRVIMLAGLDYPFGYVLVEPGYAETILTGVSTDDELLDQVDWYFGTDDEDDSTSDGTRVVSGGPRRTAAPAERGAEQGSGPAAGRAARAGRMPAGVGTAPG
jgi:hypothetical protein